MYWCSIYMSVQIVHWMRHGHSAQDHPHTIVGGFFYWNLPELPNPSPSRVSKSFVWHQIRCLCFRRCFFTSFCLKKFDLQDGGQTFEFGPYLWHFRTIIKSTFCGSGRSIGHLRIFSVAWISSSTAWRRSDTFLFFAQVIQNGWFHVLKLCFFCLQKLDIYFFVWK